MHEPRGAAGARQEGCKLSEAELEAISGGGRGWSGSWTLDPAGDTREGIDRSKVGADYAAGKLDTRDLDW